MTLEEIDNLRYKRFVKYHGCGDQWYSFYSLSKTVNNFIHYKQLDCCVQRRISDYKANKVLSMDRESLRNEVKVSDGTRKPVSIDGIEVELEWDNLHSMIVSHFWIDPKIRKNGIGTEIADETFKQTKEIDRIKEIYVTMQSADGATRRFLKKLKFDKLVEYEDDYWGNMVEGRLYLD